MFLSSNLFWRIPALLIAITFHEYAHGKAAQLQGDPTAQYSGRLTLNPLAHLDPIGLLMLWIVGFGWAKPVPINPRNFNDYYKGILKVALAGPLTNLFIAFLSIILLRVIGPFWPAFFFPLFSNLMVYNIFLAVFNIIPLPPLDGSKVLVALLPPSSRHYYYNIEPYGPFILILLLAFGLLPAILLPISQAIYAVFLRIIDFIILIGGVIS
ncbi:MAG: site-2 protease family protein [Firmicutes bacterium]|nr:site-2 protease family protein [Bacillota bacterium]